MAKYTDLYLISTPPTVNMGEKFTVLLGSDYQDPCIWVELSSIDPKNKRPLHILGHRVVPYSGTTTYEFNLEFLVSPCCDGLLNLEFLCMNTDHVLISKLILPIQVNPALRG